MTWPTALAAASLLADHGDFAGPGAVCPTAISAATIPWFADPDMAGSACITSTPAMRARATSTPPEAPPRETAGLLIIPTIHVTRYPRGVVKCSGLKPQRPVRDARIDPERHHERGDEAGDKKADQHSSHPPSRWPRHGAGRPSSWRSGLDEVGALFPAATT